MRWRLVRYVRAALSAPPPPFTLEDSLESVLIPAADGGEANEDIGSDGEGNQAEGSAGE